MREKLLTLSARAHQTPNIRRELLKIVYDDQVLEFPENNEATHIITFLADVIRNLPNVEVDRNELEIAFRIALKQVNES